MVLLVTYVCVALGFSFLCSIAEAVLLSVTMPYILILEQEGHASGSLLRRLKDDVNSPLAAILTLNTIAHTVGAAGVGAQAAAVFGNAYVGVASAILTLFILVFSEIIPKTLGAHYWRQLAPATARGLNVLIWLLYPFVWLAERLTRGLAQGPALKGFNRAEFAAMAEIGVEEGQLVEQESKVLTNLFRLKKSRVKDAMTPRTVVFSLPENLTVSEFIEDYDNSRFSRIPIFAEERENIRCFVLRSDLLLARVQGESDKQLKSYSRDMWVLPDGISLLSAFEQLVENQAHIAFVVDEYGGMEGILTLEDILETLLGQEIVDEDDKTTDMQQLARRLGKRRARELGVEGEQQDNQDKEQ